MFSPFQVAPSIRYGVVDGLCLILDLASEDFFILDEEATKLWANLTTLASAVSEDDFETEVFAKDCLARGFLVEVSPTAPTPLGASRVTSWRRLWLRRPLFLSALVAMGSVAWLLRKQGFSYIYGAIQAPTDLPSSREAPPSLGPALSAFVFAENFFWFAAATRDCLPRSLSIFLFLRSLGFPVRHHIGGRRFPNLTMHAWVDLDGKCLLDDQERIASYTIVASLPS